MERLGLTMFTPNRRNRLLIDPQFQKSFLIYSIGAVLTVTVIYFFALRMFLWHFQSMGTELGLAPNHIFFQYLQEQGSYLNLLFIFTTIGITLALGIWGLFFSNHIAGPLHKVTEYLRQYRDGKAQGSLQFRSNDYFSHLAKEINLTLVPNQKSK